MWEIQINNKGIKISSSFLCTKPGLWVFSVCSLLKSWRYLFCRFERLFDFPNTQVNVSKWWQFYPILGVEERVEDGFKVLSQDLYVLMALKSNHVLFDVIAAQCWVFLVSKNPPKLLINEIGCLPSNVLICWWFANFLLSYFTLAVPFLVAIFISVFVKSLGLVSSRNVPARLRLDGQEPGKREPGF